MLSACSSTQPPNIVIKKEYIHQQIPSYLLDQEEVKKLDYFTWKDVVYGHVELQEKLLSCNNKLKLIKEHVEESSTVEDFKKDNENSGL